MLISVLWEVLRVYYNLLCHRIAYFHRAWSLIARVLKLCWAAQGCSHATVICLKTDWLHYISATYFWVFIDKVLQFNLLIGNPINESCSTELHSMLLLRYLVCIVQFYVAHFIQTLCGCHLLGFPESMLGISPSPLLHLSPHRMLHQSLAFKC